MEVASSLADDWLRLNRAWWDERAPVHAASGFYDVPGFLAGKDSLRAFEPGEVGDVRGKRLLHLMCHIGLDTLSWARRGAVVTGLDFSQPALDTAVSLAGRAGIGSARFVAAEIGDASRALAGETFDIVYTGTGVSQWIPDIDSWARTVAALVAPGGFFYIADYHPFPDSFDIVDGEVRRLRHGYLDHGPWVEQASRQLHRPRPDQCQHLHQVEPPHRQRRQRTGHRRPAHRVPARIRLHRRPVPRPRTRRRRPVAHPRGPVPDPPDVLTARRQGPLRVRRI